MEEEEEEEEAHRLIGPGSGTEPGPMVSATVGRAMTTLLNAKPRKLHDAISRLHSHSKTDSFTVSIEQSLWFLHKYIGEAAEKGENLDQVLVPILQHSLTVKDSKQGSQVMILLNWLFQDEILLEATMNNLASIVSRRDDRYLALGWCILGRSLIEHENAANKFSVNAVKEKYDLILKILCSCVIHLLSIVCNGSIMQDGFELPTRLAVTAADFILALTVALSGKDLATEKKKSHVNAKEQPVNLLPAASKDGDKKNKLRKALELPSSVELKLLLWNNLNGLITLVKKLAAWSRKSRSLHAKGLDRVYKWLQEMKQHYACFQDETDSKVLKSASLLLSSCWRHYGILLHLETKFSLQNKELLDQYLSGIKFYVDNQAEEPNMGSSSKSETINFFLNCLMLLLGRLDNQQFGNVVTEYGSQISQVLISQLRCADEEVIDGAISIFKSVVLGTNHTLSKRSLGDIRQMEALLPVLLNLLDERDATAKAIIKLLAEYCSVCSDSRCLYDVLKRIDSKNISQRRNAVDVVAELVHISSFGSVGALSQAAWLDIANHLLECLGDEDQIIREQANNLIPMIDPPLVLRSLVGLCYSTHENIRISASTAIINLLVNHKQEPEILCLLLDCLSKLSQNPDSDAPAGTKEGSKLDADRVLKLLSDWAKHVEDWHVVVGPLIDKMLAEPSNAVIVRFLSHISEYLVDAVDLVFNRLLLYMREQDEMDKFYSNGKGNTNSNSEAMKDKHNLFSRLCPLLVIRLLPLRVFDDLNSPLVYAGFPRNSAVHVDRHFSIKGTQCIAALIVNRALSKSEFEDVRKLAAELCGRIHPEVLIPILSSQLESAANDKDLLKIKVCLFSFCTSLMVRGNNAYRHPDLVRIRTTIQKVLSWKSADIDEISKAQHGCIDCLALMLCTELQSPELSKGTAITRGSVLAYVINQLTDDVDDIDFEFEGGDRMTKVLAQLSFRLCMANVLISACQKISDTGKKSFAKKILPRVIRSAGGMVEPEIRAACLQILFTVAFHLKSWIFPYSNDLLGVALKSLREGSHKEKMAGAKLLMCLMASEEEVVESISSGLLEARSLLQKLSSTDPSPDVRQMCQQLLACLTAQ